VGEPLDGVVPELRDLIGQGRVRGHACLIAVRAAILLQAGAIPLAIVGDPLVVEEEDSALVDVYGGASALAVPRGHGNTSTRADGASPERANRRNICRNGVRCIPAALRVRVAEAVGTRLLG